ncbi:ABC transporter substrate-binding protein [Noviherbaspirillum autotrophicum]|uniref:ABC transporter permease n=1 Tax=Noviherbaspirillum autotrophicum TaxID=709839 RepID=A0A0C2BIH2_9BURK|nr:ABC transporter substrate-binding protein [Noviherbaspirillum autotrophicum]KIF79804.1 ABC transporter permease [Noviherbaspirillum autotrophicum]
MLVSRLMRTALICALSLRALAAFAETGVTDNTIVLGMSTPLSGVNGAYGVEMKEAIAGYIRQINAEGGIHNRKIELVALDDGYETERAVANTKALIDNHKAFALLGYYGTSPTTAALPVISAAKVPLIGTISGADNLRTPVNRYLFHVRASYGDETEAITDQLVSLGLKNIAVFYQNDGFGKSGLDGVTAALKKHGLAPSALGTVERNSTDVSAAVQAIAKVRPQAVVMVSLYKPTAAFVRQMKNVGSHPQYATLSPVGADLLVAELGNDARGIGISQVVPYPWNDTVPLVKEYKRMLSQQSKTPTLSYYGVEGFITAKTMVEALRRAGRDLTREKLVAALEGMQGYDVGGYKLGYSTTSHNGSKFVDLTVIGSAGKVLH